MNSDTLGVKLSATLEEISMRVARALARHPRCRNVQFEVIQVPRTGRGSNWTVNLRSVESQAVWEASEIVAEIQDAYELVSRIRSSPPLQHSPEPPTSRCG
jgi:hypothetical protein